MRRLLVLLLVACTPLEPETTMNRYTLAAASVAGFWSATGGTITPTGHYTADTVPGVYEVAYDSAGHHAAATVRVCGAEQSLTLDDHYEELAIAGTKNLTAVVTDTCGDTLPTELVTWVSRSTAVATVASTGDLTATVTAVDTGYTYVVASAGVTRMDSILICVLHGLGIDVTPATLSLAPANTGTLTATVTRCGTAVDSTVTWTSRTPAVATVTVAGVVTGVANGTSWVVADEGSTGVKDSALVTVSGGQITYFLADAETATVVPPWGFITYGGQFGGMGLLPVTSTTQAKNGTRSYKYEITANSPSTSDHSQTLATEPQTSMGCLNGRFCTGWYSFYVWIDQGYTSAAYWNMTIGWTTGDNHPISHIGLEVHGGGVLQAFFFLKNCTTAYTCPTIAGYQGGGSHNTQYWQTASSPNGITTFPRGQWVHLAAKYTMATTNGRVELWQDGVKIMDLTAPTMNTKGGWDNGLANTGGDLKVQFGIYGAAAADTRKIYVDDFRVSNYRPTP
jgi:hypothetical protein